MDFIGVCLSVVVRISRVQIYSFVIWVDPLLLGFSGLNSLGCKVLFGNRSEASLELSIGENLLSSYGLLLHRVKLIFLIFLLFHELLLLNLLLSLKVDLCCFVWSESLEMIWLFPMVGEHAYLSLWVFGHEIMIKSVVHLMLL